MAIAVAIAQQQQQLESTLSNLLDGNDIEKLLHKKSADRAQRDVERDHRNAAVIHLLTTILGAGLNAASLGAFPSGDLSATSLAKAETNIKVLQGLAQFTSSGNQGLQSAIVQGSQTRHEYDKQQHLQLLQQLNQELARIQQTSDKKDNLDKDLIEALVRVMNGCLPS